MSLYKNKYRVESTRLKNWDYSANGYYYITICTKNRECLFGDVINGEMILSEIGKMAYQYWQEIPNHFPFVRLDEFVIMPNHVHGIIIIENNENIVIDNDMVNRRDAINRASTVGNKRKIINQPINGGITGKNNPMFYQSISKIIRWYKGRCTFEINKIQKEIFFAWQTRFYDHIIRDKDDLNRIRKYIENNSSNWDKDDYYG